MSKAHWSRSDAQANKSFRRAYCGTHNQCEGNSAMKSPESSLLRSKASLLRKLARVRQKTRWPRYACIGDYHDGKYECDFVSPYTRSASNLDALLMILLQDWASDEVLSGPFLKERGTLGHDPNRLTNRRLQELLREHFAIALKDTYATNVFPFVKRGSMGSSIPKSDLVHAAAEFTLRQIEIVKPRIAVCLGKAAYNAVALASKHTPALRLRNAISTPFWIGATQVWCQPHPGRNSVARVRRSWRQMSRYYHSARRSKKLG